MPPVSLSLSLSLSLFLFAIVAFPDWVRYFYPGLASDWDPPTYASCVVWITDMNHHTWLLVDLANFLPRGGLNLWSSCSPPPE
jgi:hypothetical protein